MANKAPASAATHRWAFRTRLRRAAFGWRGSKLAITRIDEALAEIRAVARRDPAAAGEGAVILLEKLSPALCEVDSSSGALGNATWFAIKTLVPVIADAPVSIATRAAWLERLFAAMQNDDPPYIESLGDHWGVLCESAELASRWADELVPVLRRNLRERAKGVYAFFTGTAVCYSALFTAGRHDELLELLALDSHPIWPYLLWGARVLVARGKVDEAIDYMKARAGSSTPDSAIARFGEEALLQAGRQTEAYERFAIEANQANSNLATFRAIAKKYPQLDADRVLRDLIAATPGEGGKWFATAKSLKRFDHAATLAWASPCDPKTLTRAARDHVSSQPAFAAQAALAALHWMSLGHGYELSGVDVLEAHRLAIEAGQHAEEHKQIEHQIEQTLASTRPMATWMRQVLGLAAVDSSTAGGTRRT